MAREIEGVLEAALYASDLDAAEHFYSTVLGLDRIARHDDRHIFFRCGQTVVLIFNPAETVKPAASGSLPVPTHGTSGAGHLCFRVSADALDAMVARLNSAGVPIEADFRWPGGARSIYFRDPAGNSLECAEPKLWNL
ncbi:VOC family protein [Rhizobium sp. AG855]|uniref:VOC family protein n=1 Tax=Rhizobium sp. AG855 TaxID=2183898 RepID=UPI000E715A10|nr:VOC family protein [Rhizobium sp. AG855]RKE86467.1 catechol 2,3-dioxygenase-like lactoylglutathione lyase family enzyme [Rhizobium sp. AG855]